MQQLRSRRKRGNNEMGWWEAAECDTPVFFLTTCVTETAEFSTEMRSNSDDKSHIHEEVLNYMMSGNAVTSLMHTS